MINSAQSFGGFFNPVTVMNGYSYVQQPRTLDKSQMRNVITAEEQDKLITLGITPTFPSSRSFPVSFPKKSICVHSVRIRMLEMVTSL